MFVTASNRTHLVGLLPHLNKLSLCVLDGVFGHFGVNFAHDEAQDLKDLKIVMMNLIARWGAARCYMSVCQYFSDIHITRKINYIIT